VSEVVGLGRIIGFRIASSIIQPHDGDPTDDATASGKPEKNENKLHEIRGEIRSE
jgi:hypothetical protein